MTVTLLRQDRAILYSPQVLLIRPSPGTVIKSGSRSNNRLFKEAPWTARIARLS